MNNLVERYIYDVVRRLPENERNEVQRELESNIADMMPDNPSEQDIIIVLTNLGAPSKLAGQYRQKQRYLISPALYDNYIFVLKKVILIVALAVGGATALTEILQLADVDNISILISQIISSMFYGAFQGACSAFFWVTIGFIIAERRGSYKENVWTVNNLPNLPNKNNIILSRSNIIVNMALNVFFTCLIVMLIYKYESLLIISINHEVVHPFTQEALLRSIPYIVILSILSLIVSSIKLYYGRWNIPVCIVNLVHNVIWVSIAIFILNWSDLFSNDFISFSERTFTANMDIMSHLSTGGTVFIISAILIFAAVLDSADGAFKTFKSIR